MGAIRKRTVELTALGPFDLTAGVRFLEGFAPAARPDAGDDAGILRLAFPAEGEWAPAGAAVRQHDSAVTVEVFGDAEDGDAVAGQVARILSLDVDGRGFPEIGRRDPVVGRLQAQYPGLRPVSFHSPYEAACWSVVSHRIRITQAAVIMQRLAQQLGATVTVAGRTMTAFPAPQQLESTRDRAGLSSTKVERLHLASAAAIAGGGHAIPVYEMFKVGDDPYWAEGLDIFSEFGLDLVIVPHWNNKEGGEHLDTSRCYIGLDRFEYLRNLLPASAVIVGVDENTACIFEFSADEVRVIGKGSVTILHGDDVRVYYDKETFSVSSLRTAQPATSQG